MCEKARLNSMTDCSLVGYLALHNTRTCHCIHQCGAPSQPPSQALSQAFTQLRRLVSQSGSQSMTRSITQAITQTVSHPIGQSLSLYRGISFTQTVSMRHAVSQLYTCFAREMAKAVTCTHHSLVDHPLMYVAGCHPVDVSRRHQM